MQIIQSMDVLSAMKYLNLCLLCCALLAVVTNPLILWTIWRQKTLHTGCFSLIAQMALADFAVGLTFAATVIKRLIRRQFALAEVMSQLQCCFEMAPIYFRLAFQT
jgi:hypothetical protein